MTWFTAKSLFGLARGAWLAIAIIGTLLIVWAIADSFKDTIDDARATGREVGAQGAVIAGQNQTLEQLKDANDAEQDLRAGGDRSAERYAGCLLDNRRKAACERYKPVAGDE